MRQQRRLGESEGETWILRRYNMDNDLKPCPFCGSTKQSIKHITFYSIECSACGVSTLFFSVAADAKKAWNMRTEGEKNLDLRLEIERLRAANRGLHEIQDMQRDLIRELKGADNGAGGAKVGGR